MELQRGYMAVLALIALPIIARAEVLHRGGPADRCIDLVLLSESYASGDEARHRLDCQTFLAALKSHEPFARYLPFFNIYRNFKAAPTSNLDRRGETRYGTVRVGRSTTLISSNSSRISADALEVASDVDLILVICNGDLKGGTAKGDRGWVVNAPRFQFTAIHELGHMLGGCADEYVNVARAIALTADVDKTAPDFAARARAKIGSIVAGRPNVTIETSRESLPWKHWVKAETPVPGTWTTKGVSAYEGGNYFASIVHRPRLMCTMDTTEHEPFCEPCREALVSRFYDMTIPTKVKVTEKSDRYIVEIDSLVPNAQIRWINADAEGQTASIPKNRIHPQGIRVELRDPSGWVLHPQKREKLVFTKRLELRGTWSGPAIVSQPEAPTSPSRFQPVPRETPRTTPQPEAQPQIWPKPGTVTGGVRRPIVKNGVITHYESGSYLVSGPSLDTSYVMTVPTGTRLEVLGPAREGFVPVRVNDRRGYMASADVTIRSLGAAGAVGASSRE